MSPVFYIHIIGITPMLQFKKHQMADMYKGKLLWYYSRKGHRYQLACKNNIWLPH